MKVSDIIYPLSIVSSDVFVQYTIITARNGCQKQTTLVCIAINIH